MSHTLGQVRFSDGTILYCEYNGTADVMKPMLFDTVEEVQAYWRRPQPIDNESTVADAELAEAATDCGSGFSWTVRASKQHKMIVEGCDPYHHPFPEHTNHVSIHARYIAPEDGLPDWWLYEYEH